MDLEEHELWAYEKLITAEQSVTGCANEFWACGDRYTQWLCKQASLVPDRMIRELLHLILWVVVF